MTDPYESLPPWDAASWFQTTKETQFVGGANAVKVASADPQRVALVISNNTNLSATIAMTSAGPASKGLTVPGQTYPFIMRFAELGPMVQNEWWLPASSGATITVYEIRLRAWPQPQNRSAARARQAAKESGIARARPGVAPVAGAAPGP